MKNTKPTALLALRKEYRRYALRMCRLLERSGCATRLVTDVAGLLAAEREAAPDVIILDSAVSEPKTAEVIADIHDRPDGGTKLIVLGLPADQETFVRERWPDVEIIV